MTILTDVRTLLLLVVALCLFIAMRACSISQSGGEDVTARPAVSAVENDTTAAVQNGTAEERSSTTTQDVAASRQIAQVLTPAVPEGEDGIVSPQALTASAVDRQPAQAEPKGGDIVARETPQSIDAEPLEAAEEVGATASSESHSTVEVAGFELPELVETGDAPADLQINIENARAGLANMGDRLQRAADQLAATVGK